MRTTSKYRGHEIVRRNGEFIFPDTGEPTAQSGRFATCGHCGQANTPEGHDACLGTIPGAMNACCGHGETDDAYIQVDDCSRIAGEAMFEYLRGATCISISDETGLMDDDVLELLDDDEGGQG